MSQIWTAIIGLLGVIIGGFIPYMINSAQFKRDKRLKQEEIVREKLEEICKTAEDINRSYAILTNEVMMLVKFGKKIEIKIDPIPVNKLKMLVYSYAPNLKESFNILYDATYYHGEAMIYLYNIYSTGKDTMPLMELIIKLTKSITIQCTVLVEGAANIIKDHFEDKNGHLIEQIKHICNSVKIHLAGRSHADA